jgi:predicted amidohydrolase YtcJ
MASPPPRAGDLARGPGADLVLAGGKILTVDAAFTIAQAVAVTGDRIAAVGRADDVRPYIGRHTRVVDLRGRAVTPGLIDGHAHLDREGLKSVYPSLAGARSIDDVLQRIETLVRAAEPGAWIVTMPLGDPPYYWDVPGLLKEQRVPTRRDLDRVAPDNPVYIRSIWGYWRHTLPLVSIANTAALHAAGITRDTLPPWGGVQIDKDFATGEPTGVFLEWTYMPVVELSLMAAAPRFTHAQRVQALRESMRIYNGTGTTAVFEGHGIADEVGRVYRELAGQRALTVRSTLVISPGWGPEPSLASVLGSWGAWPAGRGLGDAWLRVSGFHAELGVSADNAVRARAHPYTGWAGFRYDAGLPRERLRDVLIEAARAGVRVAGITPGLLDVYAEVDRVAPIGGQRWVIGHISTVGPDDIRRLRDLGIVVTTHTNRYLYKDAAAVAAQVGAGREDTIVPLRSLREAGVPVALGTDNVPPSLFYPIWQAVARVDRTTGRVIAPAQRLSREDALRAATAAGAFLTFDEDDRGSIEVGKLADLAVLSADPLTVEESAIRDLAADLTVVGGRVVLERASP